MNKRERREKVMDTRYAKVDQRKQVSEKSKTRHALFDSMLDALMGMDHPLARKFRELNIDLQTNKNTRTDDKVRERAIQNILDWRKENPEEAEEMVKFLADLEAQYVCNVKS